VKKANHRIFITFGAGRRGWIGAAKRITAEAHQTDLFDFCFNLDDKWLKTWDPLMYEIGLNLRKTQPPRGFGYWTWKPSVLLWAHLNFPNHQIVYVDAGSQLYSEPRNKVDLASLLKRAKDFGSLAWSIPDHLEENWTKVELVNLLSPNPANLKSDQVQSGFVILSPNNNRERFCQEYRRIAELDSGFYFTDEKIRDQSLSFIEHRHDQSVLSLLWKKFGFYSEPDLSSPELNNLFPIISWRNNSFFTVESPSLIRKISKFFYLSIDKICNNS